MTWENFKHDFTEAHRDLINQRSTQTNPFQQANAVIEQFQKRTEAILDHVTNSTMDTSTISTLTTQNQTLTDQLANTTTDLLSMKNMVESLCKEVAAFKNEQPRRRPGDCNRNDKSYCLTHGRTRNKMHTSATCRNKAEGHKDESTLDNKLGGSERFCQDL